ncbi:DUF6000 family protein [Streptomyces sp. AC550_RSS872]|uniref:DUF6000 family protein n=1 Tax=Streptomyces sp. AC550_RSS872 TaxID=2823689 RepID=UPI0027E5A49C|nr:DUF6000 family protein [Streptomyces sp. AC550_RSS872]
MALASFGTACDADLLAAYLERYLRRPDLGYDQTFVMGALQFIDLNPGAGQADRFRQPGGLWQQVALRTDQSGDFGRQRKMMACEVERHHRVVVHGVAHGEFEQFGVLRPEEERQGTSRTNIERQRIVAETPVQLLGLLLVRHEDAGSGDACPRNYEFADKTPNSRPGERRHAPHDVLQPLPPATSRVLAA